MLLFNTYSRHFHAKVCFYKVNDMHFLYMNSIIESKYESFLQTLVTFNLVKIDTI